MKRILLSTSALTVSVLALGAGPQAFAETRSCAVNSENIYVCDEDPAAVDMDLSGATNAAVFVFEGQVTSSDPQRIIGTQASDNFTVRAEDQLNDGSVRPAGSVGGMYILTGEGNDIFAVERGGTAADGSQNNSGSMTNVILDMDGGNDQIIFGGNITNTSAHFINLGTGDDRMDVQGGALVQSDIITGEGDDILVNGGKITGDITMNEGDDRFQTSSTVSGTIDMGDGDDVVHAVNVAPSNPSAVSNASSIVMDGGEGYDELILDGTSLGSGIQSSAVSRFEKLVKTGEGTWTYEQKILPQEDLFADGIEIQQGTLNFNDNDNVQLTTNITNNGTLAGAVTLNAASDHQDGDTPALHNTADGTIGGSVTFSEYNDVFVNDGRILDRRSDDATQDVVINMGDGSDTFDNRGTVSGQINLGAGQDRFIINDQDLFILPPPGRIDGGIEFDTIELAGEGGRLMEVNCASCAITNFEHVDVTQGSWKFSADQDFAGDMRVSGGDLTMNTSLSARNLIIDGGTATLPGSFTALSAQINNGTLDLLNGLLTAPVTVGDQGRFQGTGTVDGNVNVAGNITPADFNDDNGRAIGVMDVNGNLVIEDGGRVVINVDPVSGEADAFDVSGFVTIEDGALIEVVALSELEEGQTFEVDIVDAGLVSGNFTIASDSQFFDYEVLYDEDQVTLLMGASYVPVIIDPAAVSNSVGGTIYAHLISHQTSGGFDSATLNQFYNYLSDNGTTDAAGAAALSQVSPEYYDAVYGLARSYASNFRDGLQARIDDKEWCGTMRGVGEDNCRASSGEQGDVWGSVDVYVAGNDASATSDSDATVVAAQMGVDGRTGLATLGVAGGFGYTSQDINTRGEASGFAASIGAYASIPMEVLNIDGDLAYHYSNSTSDRTVDTFGDTNADPASRSIVNIDQSFRGEVKTHTISGGMRVTQEYKNQGGLEFQPEAGLGFNYAIKPGFTEVATGTGTHGDIGLIVKDSEHFDMSVEIGAQVRKAFKGQNGTFIPEARAKLSHMVVGKDVDTQARFIGSNDGNGANPAVNDFVITTEQPRTVAKLGLGLNYETQSGMVLFGDYDAKVGSGVMEHHGSAGIRFDF